MLPMVGFKGTLLSTMLCYQVKSLRLSPSASGMPFFIFYF